MGIFGSIFKDITLGGVKGVFEGVGSLAKDLRSAITGEISPEKKAEIEQKILQLESLAQEGQLKINEQEAKHPSVWVSGWRPAIGWVCAVSLGSYFIPKHVMAAILWWRACWGVQEIVAYPIGIEGLLQLVGAMLGVTLWRTVEKFQGVARN